MSKTLYVAPYNIAVIHAGLDDKEAAFAALEQAYKERSYLLPDTMLATALALQAHRAPQSLRTVGLECLAVKLLDPFCH